MGWRRNVTLVAAFIVVWTLGTQLAHFAGHPLSVSKRFDLPSNARKLVGRSAEYDAKGCEEAATRVRMQTKSPPREFCHGTAKLPGAVVECPENSRGGFAVQLNGGAMLYEHPFGRFFEIVPDAIVSARRASRGNRYGGGEGVEGITIAVHAVMDAALASQLARLASVWRGYISIAVLSDDPERDGDALRELSLENEAVREWVDVHFVRRRGHTAQDPSPFYPINLLRNVASRHARTPWTMVLDVSVLPSACMDAFAEQVAAAERRFSASAAESRSPCPGLFAFIPPTVEANSVQADVTAGCTFIKKTAVGSALRSGLLQPARPRLPLAHMPVNYTAWAAASEEYEVDYEPEFAPFFVARTGFPSYNDSFVDRDWASAQQAFHMAASGYRFVVLPSTFLVDIPAPPAPAQSGVGVLWKDFVTHTSELYGVPVAYDSLFGQQYAASRSLYAREIGKYPLLVEKVQPSGDIGRDSAQQFAMVMLTYKRDDLLREVLKYYCKLPSLWGVVVIWNNVDEPVPPLRTIAPKCKRPVHIVPQTVNRITNRYRPTNLPPGTPDALFIIDDDLLFEDAAVEFAFQQWQAFPNQIVGFIPRAAVQVADGWEYGVQDKVEALQEYHFILLGASFIHKRHFDSYWRLPDSILTHVEAVRNCDDIAMNFAVARETSLPPVWVDAQYSRRSASGQFQDNNNHFVVRSECITLFMRMLGDKALVPGKNVLLPVGRKFSRLMPHVN